MKMTTSWIAVASAEHVSIGRQEGFMQICHGKAAPLRRMKPEDTVIYYSPTKTFGGKDKLQAFTAIGIVENNAPYQVEQKIGFFPFRRDVRWLLSNEASIHPLLPQLDFTVGQRSWGFKLRFGLFTISEHDTLLIAAAMRAKIKVNSTK
jgi:hypothetical protein